MGKIIYYTCCVLMFIIMLFLLTAFFDKAGFENGGVVLGKEYIEPQKYYDGFTNMSRESQYILKIKGDDGSIGRCSVDSNTFVRTKIFDRIDL